MYVYVYIYILHSPPIVRFLSPHPNYFLKITFSSDSKITYIKLEKICKCKDAKNHLISPYSVSSLFSEHLHMCLYISLKFSVFSCSYFWPCNFLT